MTLRPNTGQAQNPLFTARPLVQRYNCRHSNPLGFDSTRLIARAHRPNSCALCKAADLIKRATHPLVPSPLPFFNSNFYLEFEQTSLRDRTNSVTSGTQFKRRIDLEGVKKTCIYIYIHVGSRRNHVHGHRGLCRLNPRDPFYTAFSFASLCVPPRSLWTLPPPPSLLSA